MRSSRADKTAAAYKLAQRPEGASSREVADALDMTQEVASGLLAWMVRTGRAESKEAKDAGSRRRVRFYAGAESLDRIEARLTQAHRERLSERAGAPKGKMRPSAPVIVKLQPSYTVKAPRPTPAPALVGEPVITAATKLTVCPSSPVDARYQVAPGEKVWGAGFAAAGIGRDVCTGRGWSA